ncbi:acetate/propionate family kinase [uncultured Mucilaginibacter sp.]|uniref:acetate/propionate family kinase n=1 Tax=uncultured Mucilaginibacter sp. TaxID=797541 RepID=UPI0025F4E412|nr:acetate kinase [uncultured Mucilaginibacter sp.]
MNILVINSGSSSIKYQLFKMPSAKPVCFGLIERIGLPNSGIVHKVYADGQEKVISLTFDIPNHEVGMLEAAKLLTEPGIGVIQNPDDINVVGHRIVHGGETLTKTTIVTEQVKEEIKKIFALAPLHNPGSYQGIQVAQKLFDKATHVCVFDTAFHQTLPEKAFRYAIPQTFYHDDGIRVYGFHGISHKYVTDKALHYLSNPKAKVITIHLGNGCSMAAVNAGKCIDTSMGLTPLEGLIMGTRSGSIDPSVLIYMMTQLGYDIKQVSSILNKESGMFGLTGYSDMRDIKRLIEEGDHNALLAFEMFAYRIKKYIGSYTAALNGLDAIVFTAGIGENDVLIREMICQEMDVFGIRIDEQKNSLRINGTHEINADNSSVKILVIPTNEELEIATECMDLLNEQKALQFN